MSEPFKAYVNRAAFATTNNETQIVLYLERPIMKENGEMELVLEEQGLIVLSHEYVKKFRDALDENIKASEQRKKEILKEVVEDNGARWYCFYYH